MKTRVLESLFNKVGGPQACNFFLSNFKSTYIEEQLKMSAFFTSPMKKKIKIAVLSILNVLSRRKCLGIRNFTKRSRGTCYSIPSSEKLFPK